MRLVQDLGAVNEVVDNFSTEVPNSHILLSNISRDAQQFSVIDLCSAFFSVPLAEESRRIRLYSHTKVKNTPTR